MPTELILDLSNEREKLQLVQYVRELQGLHRVSIVKYRKRRSDAQNRYYWGVLVPIFADWARSVGNQVKDEECHEALKSRFLAKPIVSSTGEIIGEGSASTATLTTTEFSEYVERCAQWIAEFTGITVPMPNE